MSWWERLWWTAPKRWSRLTWEQRADIRYQELMTAGSAAAAYSFRWQRHRLTGRWRTYSTC